jgi:hypothetical protein
MVEGVGRGLKDVSLSGRKHNSLATGASYFIWPCSKLDRASCYGAFLREQMRSFHDLLRQKPSSLFILLGWSAISMASLTMWSLHRVLVASMEVWWNWMWCPESTPCSAMADLSGCSSWKCHWCSFNLVSTERLVSSVYTFPHSQWILYTPGVLNPKLFLTDRRKLEIFLWGMPTDLMLCRTSTLLTRLNMGPS